MSGHGEISIAYNTVCLSLGNVSLYWAFLPVDCQEDDTSLRVLSNLIIIMIAYFNNDSFYE